MKRLIYLLTIALTLLSFESSAQKLKTVTGKYDFVLPDEMSRSQGREIAIQKAKIQALEEEFGTIVSQNNTTLITGEDKNVNFNSLMNSEIKGEWIQTIGEPKITEKLVDGAFIISCKIKGKAREISNERIEIKSQVLCNGTSLKFANTNFKNGDDLYLYFSSPVKGFLAVYLIDAEDSAYCLLPYRNQENGIAEIKANKEYILFSGDKAEPYFDKSIVDEYYLSCEKESEINHLYIIFSPNSFIKASDKQKTKKNKVLPRELTKDEFEKWLSALRVKDNKMQVEIQSLTISKF